MNVKSVGKPLLLAHLLLNIIELTLVRNSISVASVRRPSASMHTLVNITGFTLVRSLTNALSVENSSDIAQSFSDIRSFTVVNEPDFRLWQFVKKLVRNLAEERGQGSCWREG